MKFLFWPVLGYISGSVLFSYYLPLWLKDLDVTQGTSDGNPGAFNCIAKAGWPLGLAALACDVLKGALPVFLAVRVLDVEEWAFSLVVAAPVVGHAWSMFRRFKGGKAIAVSFGVMLGLWPVWRPLGILALCYLFFSLIVQIQPHRMRSVIAYLCFILGVMIQLGVTPVALGCVLSAAVVIGRHWRPEPEEERPTVHLILRRQG